MNKQKSLTSASEVSYTTFTHPRTTLFFLFIYFLLLLIHLMCLVLCVLFCSVLFFFVLFCLFVFWVFFSFFLGGGCLLYLYGITIFYISRDQWSIIMRSKYRHFSESCFHLPEMGTRICWTHLLDIWKGWIKEADNHYTCVSRNGVAISFWKRVP